MIFILFLWSKQGQPKGMMAEGGGGVRSAGPIQFTILCTEHLTRLFFFFYREIAVYR